MAEFRTLELEQDGPLLRVWLNRPAVRNALDDRTLTELAALYGGLAERFDVRVVVLGGRGPSFCAGADRRDPPGRSGDGEREQRWRARAGFRACQAIADCEAITVARVHGHAVGGGLAIALACDFRVAAGSARFRLPEVDLGLPLTWGTVPRLIHEIGAARARELTLLGHWFDAGRADVLGVVHRVVPDGALDAEVDALAGELAGKPELAVQIGRSQFRSYAKPEGDPTLVEPDLWTLAMRAGTASAAFGRDGR
jgi:enoyl-CoA hydratase/carnithine racemase